MSIIVNVEGCVVAINCFVNSSVPNPTKTPYYPGSGEIGEAVQWNSLTHPPWSATNIVYWDCAIIPASNLSQSVSILVCLL